MKKFIIASLLLCFIFAEDMIETEYGLKCYLQEDNSKKRDCGWDGINEKQCLDRGCCWASTNEKNVPWCFKPVEPTEGEERYVPLEEKIDCGYYGIMANECEKTRGCYWYPLQENSKEPWCYFGKEEPQCHLKPDEKKQCGFRFITQEECEKRGCCYQELEGRDQDVWCYEPTTGRNPDVKYKEEETCEVYDKDKVDCGYNGINQEACENKGCCWEESSVRGVAWCFTKGVREIVETPQEEEVVPPQEEEVVPPQEEEVFTPNLEHLTEEAEQNEEQLVEQQQSNNNENDISVQKKEETE